MAEDLKAPIKTEVWKFKLASNPSESAFISSAAARRNFDTEKAAILVKKRTAAEDADSAKLGQGWLRVKN